MEDKHIYDKVNLIDRYDLTCAKNDLELKINETNNEIEYIEDKLSDLIVEFEVYKNDICDDIVNRGFEINELNRKMNDIKKNLHLNIMCLDDDIKKLNDEYKRKERLYILIIGVIFCLYLLFTHLQLIYSP